LSGYTLFNIFSVLFIPVPGDWLVNILSDLFRLIVNIDILLHLRMIFLLQFHLVIINCSSFLLDIISLRHFDGLIPHSIHWYTLYLSGSLLFLGIGRGEPF